MTKKVKYTLEEDSNILLKDIDRLAIIRTVAALASFVVQLIVLVHILGGFHV